MNRKLSAILILAFFSGCATTPAALQERWVQIEKSSYAAGYHYAAALYVQHGGKLNPIDKEIQGINERRKNNVQLAPTEESKSYVNVTALATMRGMEDFVLRAESAGGKIALKGPVP